MATKIPTYDAPQVGVNNINGRFGNLQVPDIVGKQYQQLGHSFEVAGMVGARIEEEADTIRTNDALNQLKEEQLRLKFDEASGYANIKGKDALNRASGLALEDEYGNKLDEKSRELLAGLSTNRQRAMFVRGAGSLRASTVGDAMKHRLNEFRTYTKSVSTGIIATAQEDMAWNYDDEESLHASIERIRAESYRHGKMDGLSGIAIEALTRKQLSTGHMYALRSMLNAGQSEKAKAYMEKYKDQMEADDLLKVNKSRKQANDYEKSQAAVDSLFDNTTSNTPRITMPDGSKRDIKYMGDVPVGGGVQAAFNVGVLGNESGGQHFGRDGKPIRNVNKNGTEDNGISQVNIGTGPEAAKDAGLPWDEHRYKNDPDYNYTIGLAHFNKLVGKYGDQQKALAAYNAGAGRVDDAVKAATMEGNPGNWLQYLGVHKDKNGKIDPKKINTALHAKVTDYVARAEERIAKKPNTRPTRADRERQFREMGLTAEQRKAGQPYLTHRENVEEASQKQKQDEAYKNALSLLDRSEGDPSVLSQSMRDDLGDMLPRALEFARMRQHGGRTVSDDDTFTLLMNNDVLARTDLTLFRDKLSNKDFQMFVKKQQKMKTLDWGLIDKTIIKYVEELGIDSDKRSNAKEINRIARYVTSYFTNADGKAVLSREDITETIAKMFGDVVVGGNWVGFSRRGKEVTTTIDQIPAEDKERIERFLKEKNMRVTENAVIAMYFREKRDKYGYFP
ncbi:MAG: transglycosylase SLT domain-containing protein [Burkholderiaceae bacterium]|jgi:soluble lytic murein transglycosylase|nr:transglycosylase SLT domain-containing protein [Burkholderiaceae bacterium]